MIDTAPLRTELRAWSASRSRAVQMRAQIIMVQLVFLRAYPDCAPLRRSLLFNIDELRREAAQ